MKPSVYQTLVCVLGLLLLSGGQSAQGQTTSSGSKKGYARYLSVIVGVGPSYYFGDITSSFRAFASTRGQANVAAKMRFDEHLSLRGEFTYYAIGASDSKDGGEELKTRNLSFRSRNVELAAIMQYDFVPRASLYSRYARRPHYSPYAYGGLAVTSLNPKAKYNGEYYALRELKTEGVSYAPVALSIPLGIGLKIKITPEADILLDYGYRFAFTDRLDDISGGRYQGRSAFDSDIAFALSDRRKEGNPNFVDRPSNYPFRGSSKGLDAYAFFSVKYQYTFSKSQLRRFKRGVSGQFKSRLNRYR